MIAIILQLPNYFICLGISGDSTAFSAYGNEVETTRMERFRYPFYRAENMKLERSHQTYLMMNTLSQLFRKSL